jgi:di/tricarboxylate transporter
LAKVIGGFVAHTADGTGTLGLLTTIYITTVILSAIVTSKAAVALMFPITVSITEAAGLDFRPVVFLLMMAASANFLTPISYQTNLMVFGPGRYRFADFTRFGLPLQVLVGGVTLTCVYLHWL